MPSRAAVNHWLFKSEPDVYSFADLQRDGRTCWNGVRNFQARNLLRDRIAVGDLVFFYHSNAEPMCIAGLARVVRNGYPDDSAFDRNSPYHDPDSDPQDPTWYMVDIEPVAAFAPVLERERLKGDGRLAGMMLLQRGARLSVQPVEPAHAKRLLELAGVKA